MAQWIRHLTTNQGIPGSSHGGDVQLFFSFTIITNSKTKYMATPELVNSSCVERPVKTFKSISNSFLPYDKYGKYKMETKMMI